MNKNDVVYDQFQRKKIKTEIYIKHIIANFLLFNIPDSNILRESYVTIIKVTTRLGYTFYTYFRTRMKITANMNHNVIIFCS